MSNSSSSQSSLSQSKSFTRGCKVALEIDGKWVQGAVLLTKKPKFLIELHKWVTETVQLQHIDISSLLLPNVQYCVNIKGEKKYCRYIGQKEDGGIQMKWLSKSSQYAFKRDLRHLQDVKELSNNTPPRKRRRPGDSMTRSVQRAKRLKSSTPTMKNTTPTFSSSKKLTPRQQKLLTPNSKFGTPKYGKSSDGFVTPSTNRTMQTHLIGYRANNSLRKTPVTPVMNEIEKLKREIKCLQADKQTSTLQTQKTENNWKTKVRKIKEANDVTESKLKDAETKIAAFEKNKAGLAADFEITLTAIGVEKEGLKEKYEAQVKNLMSEKENLMSEKEKQKKEFNIKYSNLTKDNGKYKKQIKSTEKAQMELQEQLEKSQTEWQTKNAKLTKEFESSKKECATLTKKYKKQDLKFQKMDDTLKKSKVSQEKLKKEKNSVVKDLKEKKKEHDKLFSNMEKLKKKYTKEEKLHLAAKKLAENLKKENQSLLEQKASLENKLSSMKIGYENRLSKVRDLLNQEVQF